MHFMCARKVRINCGPRAVGVLLDCRLLGGCADIGREMMC